MMLRHNDRYVTEVNDHHSIKCNSNDWGKGDGNRKHANEIVIVIIKLKL